MKHIELENYLRNGIVLGLICIILYLLVKFPDTRKKSYFNGDMISVSEYVGARHSKHICRVKLDSGTVVDASCNPAFLKNKRVKLIKLQTIGDNYVYNVMPEN